MKVAKILTADDLRDTVANVAGLTGVSVSDDGKYRFTLERIEDGEREPSFMTERRVQPDGSRLDDIDRLLKSLNERHCELANSTRVALARLSGITEKLEGNVKHLLDVCGSYPDSDWDADLTTLKDKLQRLDDLIEGVAASTTRRLKACDVRIEALTSRMDGMAERFDRFESILHTVATRNSQEYMDGQLNAIWSFIKGGDTKDTVIPYNNGDLQPPHNIKEYSTC